MSAAATFVDARAARAPRPWQAPAEAAAPLPIERARARLTLALLGFVAVTFVLVLRLMGLALLSAPPAHANSAQLAWSSSRADIVDRYGRALARGVESYAIVVRPKQLVTPAPMLAARLGQLFDRDPASFAARLSGGPKRLSGFLLRRASPEMARRVNALGDPGIEIEPEASRAYPQRQLAAHIVGFIGDEGHGLAGMERASDKSLLTPHAAPLTLSLDLRVQQALESELAAGMAKHSAAGAAGVVMDVDTGEVVAMASLPAYDPANPGGPRDPSHFDNATLGVYELGSTFKAITIAMALDTGAIAMKDSFDARAPIHVGRFTIHDDHPKSRILSLPEVFIYSSNIGTARIAQKVGEERQRAYLQRIGFLDTLQVELPERGKPQFPATWGESAVMTVGFGHGIAVSPLHLATAYAALVNGGVWRPATLLKVAPGTDRPGKRVFSQETSDHMRALMRLVVMKGTARQAEAKGYRIGGKTGTANKVIGGRYSQGKVVSTFAGAFPMDHPRYVVLAMLDTPQGTKDTYGFKTAGWVSAPIVRKLVERIGPMLGVAPDMTHDISVEGLLPGDAKAEE